MRAVLRQGKLLLRMGSRFGLDEAQRLHETVLSFSPLCKLTLDFTAVRDFQDSTLGILARTLGAGCAVKVVMRGLTPHQAQRLNYVGEE